MQQAINKILSLTLCAVWLLIVAQITLAQTTQFTYQGKLSDSGAPANGNFDLQFKLFDTATVGTQQGATVTVSAVPVTGGIFTVTLDFGGGVFTGANRFLEIAVRPAGVGGFTLLSPRQPVTSNPYAIKSLNAAAADGLSVACVNCVTSSQIASAPPGSASSYVQNTTTQQPGADFNISGNGTVGGTLTGNIVNAVTQFNLGGNRVLSVGGTANLFAGVGAGQNNAGIANTFVGSNAGRDTSGSFNVFVGNGAGIINTTGFNNSFFGVTGLNNTTGSYNSFFGLQAGLNNMSGGSNAFFGGDAGLSNLTGNSNSFFGTAAGTSNTTGSSNTVIGASANVGSNNLSFATAVGANAVVSSSNTVVLGRSLDMVQVPGNLSVAGSLMGNFTVPASNITGVLGVGNGGTGLNSSGTSGNFLRSNGANWTSSSLLVSDIPNLGANYIQNTTTTQPANFNISGAGTANIFSATAQYNIGGFPALRIQSFNQNTLVGNTGQGGSRNSFFGELAGASNTGSDNSFFGSFSGNSNGAGSVNAFFGTAAGGSNTTGAENSFFGYEAGVSNQTACCNSFFGRSAGSLNTGGSGNTFVGLNAGDTNVSGNGNTIIGFNADVGSGSLTNATAIGANAVVSQSNSLVLGNNADVGIGTTAPASRLHLNGNTASFAVTLTNSANTAGRRGYRLAFDNDRFSFQRADDVGNFADNQVAIDQATGNVAIGDTAPLGKLQVVTANDTSPSIITAWDSRHFIIGGPASSGGIGMSYDQTNNVGYITAASPNVSFRNLVLQSAGGNVGIGTGTTAPQDRLHVLGIIRVDVLGSAGNLAQLCLNTLSQISTCSSSLRYKTNIKPFSNGLNFINLLRPIAFSWKDGGMKDVGFGAEDVEKISPLLVTYNSTGQVEGVKYDRLSVVFVNAFKEQQEQIKQQQEQITQQQGQLEHQQKQIDSLKQIVCSMNPQADICK